MTITKTISHPHIKRSPRSQLRLSTTEEENQIGRTRSVRQYHYEYKTIKVPIFSTIIRQSFLTISHATSTSSHPLFLVVLQMKLDIGEKDKHRRIIFILEIGGRDCSFKRCRDAIHITAPESEIALVRNQNARIIHSNDSLDIKSKVKH